MTKQMPTTTLIGIARNVVARFKSKEFFVRIDLTDVEQVDEAYGDGAGRHVDLLLARAVRKFCGDDARMVQDGPMNYVVVVRAASEEEAHAFAACVYDEFFTLLFDAGYECTVRREPAESR